MANEEEYFSANEDDNIPIFNIYDKMIDKKDDIGLFVKRKYMSYINRYVTTPIIFHSFCMQSMMRSIQIKLGDFLY